jgi:hypothetical protein
MMEKSGFLRLLAAIQHALSLAKLQRLDLLMSLMRLAKFLVNLIKTHFGSKKQECVVQNALKVGSHLLWMALKFVKNLVPEDNTGTWKRKFVKILV